MGLKFMHEKDNLALVIGAGAFGTAMAQVLTTHFKKVILKVRSEDIYDALKKGENSVYLPGLKIASNIDVALTWDEVDSHKENCELVVSGLPSSGVFEFFSTNKARMESYFNKNIPLVSLSKGIDPETLELSDDLLFDLFPQHKDLFTFLSGPSFAHEIMQGQITLVTLAGRSKHVIEEVAAKVNTPFFKVMGSYDIKGVLLGGALKNILAIAGGIIEGLGYNHNTRAALITRGVAEMLRFGVVYNARPETFYGPSGMGDLILTTTGGSSRNKLFGIEVAKGRKPRDIINHQRSVVEGYKTAKAAQFISDKFDFKAQIFNGVYEVLYLDANPNDVIARLMQNPTRFEI